MSQRTSNLSLQVGTVVLLLSLQCACQTYPWDPDWDPPGADAGSIDEPDLVDDAGLPDAPADAGPTNSVDPAAVTDAPTPDASIPLPDAGTGTPPTLSITLPDLGGRAIFSSDDIAVRRILISHDGAELSCSRGGGTFGDCGESGALIWSADDFHQSHTIRVSTSGAPATEMDLTPSALFPDLEFVDCTDEIAADESSSEFNARLTTPFRVICLEHGVTIAGPTTIGADNITILARLGEEAHFVASSADAIDTAGRSGVDLVALDVLTLGGTLHAAVRISPGSSDVRIHDSKLRCEANNCYVLYVKGAVEARRSVFLGGMQTSSYSYGIYGYGFAARLDMAESEVQSRANTLYCAVGARFEVRDSELTSHYPSVSTHTGAITVYNSSARLGLTNSTLQTTGLPALLVGGVLPIYATLDGNLIRKVAGTSSGQHDVIYSVSEHPVLHSTSPNVFCNAQGSTSDGEFSTTLVSGDYNLQGSSFDSASQIGVADCQNP